MARSTFRVLFYANGSKEKNGIVPVMGRVTINGTVAQFSCKRSISKELWDAKGNCAKGKSVEARETNRTLDNINAQIIKHYQRISNLEAFVTAEMVRNAYHGIGGEYERCSKPSTVRTRCSEACRQGQEAGDLSAKGSGKELCSGVHQVVLQA